MDLIMCFFFFFFSFHSSFTVWRGRPGIHRCGWEREPLEDESYRLVLLTIWKWRRLGSSHKNRWSWKRRMVDGGFSEAIDFSFFFSSPHPQQQPLWLLRLKRRMPQSRFQRKPSDKGCWMRGAFDRWHRLGLPSKCHQTPKRDDDLTTWNQTLPRFVHLGRYNGPIRPALLWNAVSAI